MLEKVETFDMNRNKSAIYLQNCGLSGNAADSEEAFKAMVPLVTDVELEPYIKRMVDGDTSPILTGHPVPAISLSSGTSQGRPKFIPFTDELMENTLQLFRTAFAFRNRDFPIDDNGRALQFIFGSKQYISTGGVPVGTATTNVYRNPNFKAGMKSITSPSCSPDEVWEEIVTDIKDGVLSNRITVPSVRTAMSKLLTPNPELAETIRSKCMSLSNCHDYGSSEGWIAANVTPKLSPEEATFAVIPNLGYFEFLPVSETGEGEEKPVGLTEVKIGEEYEVVITNYAGLYRYRLGDVVKIIGFYNNTPQLKFICRRNLILSINIDKNTERDLQLSVESAAKRLSEEKIEVIDFSSHIDVSTDPGHYAILGDFRRNKRRCSSRLLQLFRPSIHRCGLRKFPEMQDYWSLRAESCRKRNFPEDSRTFSRTWFIGWTV
ncbi:unnamed protein product [Arabidopsis arenosa]|uniref:Auxin-responsive GH3 family protein n=1 Tax=Arabidopsis arenosa TaxID=38785 RepID=A0A8S2A9H3_ARAAE|nr:unnamed protein product [Arabidopsis arenosa]